MKRLNIALIVTGGLAIACQPNNADDIAALTKRVDELEKKVAAQPQRARRPRRPDPKHTYYLPVRDDDPFRGAEHAKVTIVEAYEFACPYCAMIEPSLAKVLDKYKGTDMVKVVSKQYIVHPQLATDAALATCAAHAQGKFEPFAEALWKKSWAMGSGRPRMQRDQLKRAELIALAGTVGLDAKRFETDLSGAKCKAKVQRDRTDLARIGVHGTPYIFINGRYYTGGRSAEALAAAVEAAAKKADAALTNGIAVADYYGSLMKTARRQL